MAYTTAEIEAITSRANHLLDELHSILAQISAGLQEIAPPPEAHARGDVHDVDKPDGA